MMVIKKSGPQDPVKAPQAKPEDPYKKKEEDKNPPNLKDPTALSTYNPDFRSQPGTVEELLTLNRINDRKDQDLLPNNATEIKSFLEYYSTFEETLTHRINARLGSTNPFYRWSFNEYIQGNLGDDSLAFQSFNEDLQRDVCFATNRALLEFSSDFLLTQEPSRSIYFAGLDLVKDAQKFFTLDIGQKPSAPPERFFPDFYIENMPENGEPAPGTGVNRFINYPRTPLPPPPDVRREEDEPIHYARINFFRPVLDVEELVSVRAHVDSLPILDQFSWGRHLNMDFEYTPLSKRKLSFYQMIYSGPLYDRGRARIEIEHRFDYYDGHRHGDENDWLNNGLEDRGNFQYFFNLSIYF